jgi:hypothetical protein
MAKRYKFRNKPQKEDRKIGKSRSEKLQKPTEVFPITKKEDHLKENIKKEQIRTKVVSESAEPERVNVIVEPEERFDKAFAFSLGLIAILSLTFFIPIVGPIMGLTFVPYLACNLGCRYVQRSNGIQVGLLVGVLWAIIELYILFQILTIVKISVAEPGIYTDIDLVIIVFIFLSNIIFCMIGGYTGGGKFKTTWNKRMERLSSKHVNI